MLGGEVPAQTNVSRTLDLQSHQLVQPQDEVSTQLSDEVDK